MIESHLSTFVRRRLEAVEQIDRHLWPEESLKDSPMANRQSPSLSTALRTPPHKRINVLVEIKKASPSLGPLSQAKAVDMCSTYVSGGAKAISVLVDQPNFQGHPQDLLDCVQKFPDFPFLFKDFVATSYQIKLARALGASAVLLMTQLLEKSELIDLFQYAIELGLEPFVETHSCDELKLALELNPPIIGINSRDFKDKSLAIDLATAPRLLKQIKEPWPKHTALVAQSGIQYSEDIDVLLKSCPAGLPHAVQVGSSLSQAGLLPPWLS